MENKLFLIISALFLFFFLGSLFVLSAPGDFPKESIFLLEEGRSLRGVSLDLKEAKIIRSRLIFEAFVFLSDGEKGIRKGYYFFEEKIPVFEVARRLTRADRHLAPIRITFPEGLTGEEMAELLEKELPDFDRENFLIKAREREGYLFPDTYFFFPGDKTEEVLEAFLSNYEKKVAPLRTAFEKAGKTEEEIITMASVIEKEAKGEDDRGVIAGILWRRFSIGMMLQADAAPETYEKKGLPERPIANPGLRSIEAALTPVSSPYLFYLHDKEGKIHYAKSYAEHLSNINRYLRK